MSCFIGGNESRSGRGADNEAKYDGKGIMLETGNSGRNGGLRRWAADFALAFILFWAALLFNAGQSRAYAVSLPALAKEAIQPDSPVSRPASLPGDRLSPAAQSIHKAQTSPEQALALLSVAFAALAALNLGFWRHLRRVYASPRRSVWRRG